MKLILQTSTVALSLATTVLSAPQLQQRTTDNISSCGSRWMPRDNVFIADGKEERVGFTHAVEKFCNAASGKKVDPGDYLSMATEVFHSGGKDPSTYGILGYVYFEIHNKLDDKTHTVDSKDCKSYLNALSADGGKCSGEENKDTKGGTWQVGDEDISYHALGELVPPEQHPLNKFISSTVLKAQSVNKGHGAPLSPWPLDSLNNVRPAPCHSHNDYDQKIPLFSALGAGCVGIEVDVHYSDDDALIGHNGPTPGRTLKSQYIEPIRAILDHNNGGSPGNKGVFAAAPDQSLDLLIDFKTSDDKTLDAVRAALQPLRDGGYLSYFDGKKFVRKQVTVSCSGDAPFERIAALDHRDVFYDAKLDKWNSMYTLQNSNYASANFKKTISSDSFSNSQRDEVSKQVSRAHDVGLTVRYYDLPGDYMWEPLRGLRVDRLNADDMSSTARLLRIPQCS